MNLTPKTMPPNTLFFLQKHQSLHKNTLFSPSSITHKSKTTHSQNKHSKHNININLPVQNKQAAQ